MVATIYQLYLHRQQDAREGAGSEVASIVDEEGDVAFRSELDVDWQSTGDVESFYEEELLSTGPDSKIRLDFGEDRYLDLESNTLIKLSKPKGLSKNVEIFLITGNVSAGIKASSSGKKAKSSGSGLVIASEGQKIVLSGNNSNISLSKKRGSTGLKVKAVSGKAQALIGDTVTPISKPEVIQGNLIAEQNKAIDVPLKIVNSPSIVKSLEAIKVEQNRVTIQEVASAFKKPVMSFDSLVYQNKKGNEVPPPHTDPLGLKLHLHNVKDLIKLRPLIIGASRYHIEEGKAFPKSGIYLASTKKIIAYYEGAWRNSKSWTRVMKSLGAKVVFKGKMSSFVPTRSFKLKNVPRRQNQIYLASSGTKLVNLELELARKVQGFDNNVRSSKSVVFMNKVKLLKVLN